MRATEILSSEHRVIEQVLDCLDQLIIQCDQRARCDWKSAAEILQFLRTFADRCHHGKEEEKLFPMMESRGFSPSEGPTAVMRSEHELGRRLMTEMTNAVHLGQARNPLAVARFANAAKQYVGMLRAHIQKEDHCLFPMADRVMSEADNIELLKQFDAAENQHEMQGEHEKYLKLANELADRLSVPRAKVAAGCHIPCCGHV